MTADDAIAKALADAQRPRETWQHDDGETTVAGVVVELTEIETGYGVSPLITLDVPGKDALQQVPCFGTVLGNRVRSAYPPIEPGDVLAIAYQGQKTPRSGGKPYHDWTVVHRGPDGGPKRPPTGAGAPVRPRPSDDGDGLLPGLPEPLPGEEPL